MEDRQVVQMGWHGEEIALVVLYGLLQESQTFCLLLNAGESLNYNDDAIGFTTSGLFASELWFFSEGLRKPQ